MKPDSCWILQCSLQLRERQPETDTSSQHAPAPARLKREVGEVLLVLREAGSLCYPLLLPAGGLREPGSRSCAPWLCPAEGSPAAGPFPLPAGPSLLRNTVVELHQCPLLSVQALGTWQPPLVPLKMSDCCPSPFYARRTAAEARERSPRCCA